MTHLKVEESDIITSAPAPRYREWIWLFVTAIGLLVVYISPLKEYLSHFQDVGTHLQQLGWVGPWLFLFFMTVATASGVPRMLFYPLAGIAFELYGAFLWSIAGSLLGAYLTFLYARWAGRGLVERKWPRLHQLSNLLDKQTFLTVALIRQIPSPGYFINLVLGISPVGHSAFLLGTLIGCLPAAIPAVLIGNSLAQPDAQMRLVKVITGIGVLLVVWVGFTLYLKKAPRYQQLRQRLGLTTDGYS